MTLLQQAGIRLLALTPAADADDISDLRLGPEERVGLLLGAEGPGLTEATLAAADQRVRIPIGR